MERQIVLRISRQDLLLAHIVNPLSASGSMIGPERNGPQGAVSMKRNRSHSMRPTAAVYGIGRDVCQGQNAKYRPVSKKKSTDMAAKAPARLPKRKTEVTIPRRLPTECARLQGFPDWWCRGLETEHPTDEEVYFWYKVFETYRKITGEGREKTDKQLRAWLKDPHSDSAEYKLWGNGVALPCVFFVLSGIVWAHENIK